MKKTSIFLGLVTMGLFASAQTRTTLYEEFTGENCGPCASTNPGLNVILAGAPNVIAIKWQVPIPSAPSNTWSLYQTNKSEIDWRYSGSGYNYPSQNTPTNSITNGINSAPSGRIDGRHQWNFGATSDHPGYITAPILATAQSNTTNFSIAMTTSWSPTFTNCIVNVTVTSSAAFTATGNLVYRLCLVERMITFPSAPGSNGEMVFEDAVRKSYPTTGAPILTSMGTTLNTVWTPGQTQTLSISCNIPTYLNDVGQAAFVGFIQDDGTKRVFQASRTAQPSIPNEAKAQSVAFTGSVVCSSTMAPTATLKNNGVNAITAMTVTPYMNMVAGTPVVWTGNLAAGATTTIPMGSETIINGTNTYSINITGVSGGDVVLSNNGTSGTFFNTATYGNAAVVEGFTNPSYPPTGWAFFNPTAAKWGWERTTAAGGFGTSSDATRLFINWTAPGGYHDLYLPGTSLTGTNNPALKFDLAYTQIATGDNDRLEVWVSTNCGASWASAWFNQGNAMATTPVNATQLNVPTASQWTLITVPLTSYSNSPSVLVRFRATSDQGNSIYLDNINLFNNPSTGISKVTAEANTFEIFPNPASNELNVSITSANPASSKVNITNTVGQVVLTKEISLNSGLNTIQIDTKSLASGIYFVTYDSEKGSVTKKLTITK